MRRDIRKTQPGFTLVELVIVIVIIAILAAITIVAYNGITSRARTAALQSDLKNAADTLALFSTNNQEQYPADTVALTSNIKLSSGDSVVTYIVNNTTSPANYCLTLVNNTTNTNYSITSQNSAPTVGTCVTNLVTNPSFEGGTDPWQSWNGLAISSSEQTYRGSYSIKVTPSTSNLFTGVWIYPSLDIGSTYTFSVYVYSTTSQNINFAADGAGVSNGTGQMLGANWKRLLLTGSATTTGPLFVRATNGTGVPFYVDAAMITQGSTLYNYADPTTSPYWFWNGTANNSTSTGPTTAS